MGTCNYNYQFSRDAQLINNHVGVYEKDGLVQYIVNGAPVYAHAKDDINAFRFITSNFIHQGICRKVEIKALCGAGILFMLPSLLAQGLLKAKEVIRLPASHYYGLNQWF